jgi:Tfp pilus assembly protein PilO
MIDFKDPQLRVPSIVFLVALLLLVGAGAALLLPRPDADVSTRGRERSRRQLEQQIEQAKTLEAGARAAAATRLSAGSAESVTASTLSQLTRRANERKLILAGFRPQKPQLVEGVTELPFSVQVTGPYPAVRAFLDAFDLPTSRLALRSLQVAATDGATSAVTASVTFCAYIAAAPAAPVAQTGARRG